MKYILSMQIRENGAVRHLEFTKETERACDEEQLAQMEGFKASGIRLLSAGIIRVRERSQSTLRITE